MKNTLIVVFILHFFCSFSQNNDKSTRLISGYLTFNNKPLASVNIKIKNSETGVVTNKAGYYSIKASKGDIIRFSYLGMEPVEVVVEDVTNMLNIEMFEAFNDLDEVVVQSKKKDPIEEYRNKYAYAASYISGDDLNPYSISLAQALKGRIAGYRVIKDNAGEEEVFLRKSGTINGTYPPALWVVDDMIYNSIPNINIDNIHDRELFLFREKMSNEHN